MEDMPPGYRFYPTEEELVSFYLRNKLDGKEREDMNRIIPVLDIYDYNPWDLPQVSGEANLRDTEQWFFFIPRQESEARGGRPKRLTTSGYWKATGSPSHVYSSDNRIIGMKRTMVFYSGRAPSGNKTDWKMNEYKAIKPEASSSSTAMLSQEFSLCRVYKKSKSVRAFDRRPAPGNVNDIGYHPKGSGITVNTHQKGESGDHQRESSSESLSSGEQGEPSHSGEGSQMDIESEPLLDWDHLDWFLGPDQP